MKTTASGRRGAGRFQEARASGLWGGSYQVTESGGAESRAAKSYLTMRESGGMSGWGGGGWGGGGSGGGGEVVCGGGGGGGVGGGGGGGFGGVGFDAGGVFEVEGPEGEV